MPLFTSSFKGYMIFSMKPAAIKYDSCNPNLQPEYFSNAYFSITVWWSQGLIHQIDLIAGTEPVIRPRRFPYSETIDRAMSCYETGKQFSWADPPLNWSSVTAFQKQIYSVLLQNIPFGRTVSYGKLARIAGRPGAARAVGRAMSANPWPLIVPCHRVLAADGKIGGFSSGPELKKTLLSLEGLFFSKGVAKERTDD